MSASSDQRTAAADAMKVHTSALMLPSIKVTENEDDDACVIVIDN